MDSVDTDGFEESPAVKRTLERISEKNSKCDTKVEEIPKREKGTSFFQFISEFFDFIGDILEIFEFFTFILKIIAFPIIIYLLRNEIIYIIKIGASFLF